jgi:hypothetical protein
MEFLKKLLIENLPIAHAIVLLLVSLFIVAWVAYSEKLKEYTIDDSGKRSMGRLLCLMVTIFYLVSIAYVSFCTRTVPDFPTMAFALVTGLYAANKFSITTPFNPK